MIKNAKLNGAMYALAAALLFSVGNLTIRFAADYMSIWHMVLGRAVLGLLGLVVFSRLVGCGLWGANRLAMSMIGLVNVAAVLCLAMALIMLPLFEALVLLYLYPAFAAALSPRLVGERIDMGTWFLVGAAFAGAVLLLWPQGQTSSLGWGHLLGLLSALGIGLSFTLIRRHSPANHPVSFYFYFCLAAVAVCVWPVLLQPQRFSWQPEAGLWLLLMAVVFALAQVSSNKSLASIPSPEAGVISMSEVVWSALLGFLVFDEGITWRSAGGALLIIGSGVALNLKALWQSRGKTSPPSESIRPPA